MIDLNENNIMFTLNGEMLMSDSGSDVAFKEIEIGDGKHQLMVFFPLLVGPVKMRVEWEIRKMGILGLFF